MKIRRMTAMAAVGLFAGLPASADSAPSPALAGSTAANGGVRYGCEDLDCLQFRLAGCPESLAKAHGLTASIVDVSDVAGQTLTFTWSDKTMGLYDAGLGTAGVPISRMYFYVVTSCQDEAVKPLPIWLALSTLPDGRSATQAVPANARWLIAVPMDNAFGVTWAAASG